MPANWDTWAILLSVLSAVASGAGAYVGTRVEIGWLKRTLADIRRDVDRAHERIDQLRDNPWHEERRHAERRHAPRKGDSESAADSA